MAAVLLNDKVTHRYFSDINNIILMAQYDEIIHWTRV